MLKELARLLVWGWIILFPVSQAIGILALIFGTLWTISAITSGSFTYIFLVGTCVSTIAFVSFHVIGYFAVICFYD